MITYELELAWQGLRRNAWLSVVAVATIATGIAVSMTSYAVLHAISHDPLPEASSRLFAPTRPGYEGCAANTSCLWISWSAAAALHDAGLASRQAVMFPSGYVVTAGEHSTESFETDALVTHADLFAMFGLKVVAGEVWSSDDEAAAVLTASMAEELFGQEDAVGRTITLDGFPFRVSGVVEDWAPSPNFYSPRNRPTSLRHPHPPKVFVPIDTALALPGRAKLTTGEWACLPPGGNTALRETWLSVCHWVLMWVELEDDHAVQRFIGGLPPDWRLLTLREFVADFVPPRYRLAALAGSAVLAICLAAAVALLLSRFRVRGSEMQVRRALGASTRALFGQCWWEATLLGLAGAVLGLALMLGGIALQRPGLLFAAPSATSVADVAIVVALASVLCAGIVPAWIASRPASGNAETGGLQLSTVLLAGQAALAVGVLSNALYVLAAPTYLVEPGPGQGLDQVDTFILTTSWGGAPEELKPRAEADVARLRELPSVLGATFSPHVPAKTELAQFLPYQGVAATVFVSDPDSQDAIGARIVDGRWLRPEDFGSNHVLLSKALADISGAVADQDLEVAEDSWLHVIGVFDYSLPALVVPPLHDTIASREGRVHYLVRAKPGQLEAAMRDAVRSLGPGDPHQTYYAPEPYRNVRARAREAFRGAVLTVGLACSALVLVLCASVATLAHQEVLFRRASLMIRRALGARRGDIVRRFHTRSVAIVFTGSVLGIPLAHVFSNWLRADSLGLLPHLLVSMALVLIASQLAVLWPALEAAWTPPAAAGKYM